MIIVLKDHAAPAAVEAFCRELRGMGFTINDSMGSDTHILGLIGDTKSLSESWVLANPVVKTCRRVSEPYKKANRKFHPDDTIVDVGGHKIGGGYFAVMAGPWQRGERGADHAGGAPRPGGRGLRCCAAGRSSRAPARTASRGCGPKGWTCWPKPAKRRGSRL